MDNPTDFKGEAFDEDVELGRMNESARKMALRDSSAKHLELAFTFWDEDVKLQTFYSRNWCLHLTASRTQVSS